jgi:septal ring factor EnvC (AmiA/AmiB activator)
VGHPSWSCPNKKEKGKGKDKSKSDDDEKSVKSTASSVKKLTNEMKKMQKKYESVNTQLKALQEADSDLSESEEETSHFQFEELAHGFTQVDDPMPRIATLFKQSHNKSRLDLTKVILLDSQSTMDLFCNRKLVSNVRDTKEVMRLKSNGGTMKVTKKATMAGYEQEVWFDD